MKSVTIPAIYRVVKKCSSFFCSMIVFDVCVNAQSCPTVSDPIDNRPPRSSVHEIFQARILEVAISSSRGSSQTRIRTRVSYISCIGRQILYAEPPGKSFDTE